MIVWYIDYSSVKLSLKRKNIPKGIDIIMSSRSLSKNCGKLVLKQSTSLHAKLPRVSFSEENHRGLRGPWAPSCVWLSVHVYTTNEDRLKLILCFQLINAFCLLGF